MKKCKVKTNGIYLIFIIFSLMLINAGCKNVNSSHDIANVTTIKITDYNAYPSKTSDQIKYYEKMFEQNKEIYTQINMIIKGEYSQCAIGYDKDNNEIGTAGLDTSIEKLSYEEVDLIKQFFKDNRIQMILYEDGNIDYQYEYHILDEMRYSLRYTSDVIQDDYTDIVTEFQKGVYLLATVGKDDLIP